MTKTVLIASVMMLVVTSVNAVKVIIFNDFSDFPWRETLKISSQNFQDLRTTFSFKQEGKDPTSWSVKTGGGAFEWVIPKDGPAVEFSLDYEIRTFVDYKLVETVTKKAATTITVKPEDHIEFRLKKITHAPTALFYVLFNVNNPSSPIMLVSKLPRLSEEKDENARDGYNSEEDSE